MKTISKEYEGGLGKAVDRFGALFYKNRNRGTRK